MTLLSRPAILRALAAGDIVIDPFDQRCLGTSSYDCTLGPYFYREHRDGGWEDKMSKYYNPYSEEAVRDVWLGPYEAKSIADEVRCYADYFNGVHRTDRVIMISPGETILAHTNEFIGGACNNITTMMKARSSLGRNFIEVCKCAGWGDIPYFNRWTMEITNNSKFHTIPLVVGRRVAQIVFFETEPLDTEGNYVVEGKYQSSKSIVELKTNWNPTMMLPKMYNDWELRDNRP